MIPTDIAPEATAPTRAQYAALRAWLQGMPVEFIAGRWLATDPDDVLEPRAALALLHSLRDALVQRARQHGRDDLAEAASLPGRSGKGMDRAIEAVRELEKLAKPAPQPEHGVGLWLAAPLARRLQAANILTLGELTALCNQRGSAWWRRVPRVGPLAAARVVRVLERYSASLGPLSAHVTGIPPAGPLAPTQLGVDGGTALPLEAMRLPRELDGSKGLNRAPLDRCMIGARDDYQAIQTWLSLWPTESQTYRAYRKEAERFLGWIIIERGRAFADALTDDCIAYRAFLADPQPAARWCGPRAAREIQVAGTSMHNPAWRPFLGPLAPRSRAFSETVLNSLCAWLVDRRYLAANPWAGVPLQRVAKPSMHVEKAIAMPVWEVMSSWLDAEAFASARGRLLRAAVLLLRETGMRCDEAARAVRMNLVPLANTSQGGKLQAVWGELNIVGKGGRERFVPISQRLRGALEEHWADLANADSPLSDDHLIAPLVVPNTPRARAKANEGRQGYSARGLRQLIEETSDRFLSHISSESPELLAEMTRIYPHAFRHAFGAHGLAAGMGINVVQGYLGHASIATTTLYSTADRDRRLYDVEKFYRTT